MQIHENFNMDNTTSFNNPNGYTVKLSTIIFVVAIFLCSIIGASLLVYNFAACPEDLPLKSSLYPDHHYHVSSTSTVQANNITTITTVETISPALNETHQPNEKDAENRAMELRLPRSIIPSTYYVKVIPFLVEGKFTFDGDVRILAKVTEDCKNVTLHSVGLKIFEKDVYVRLVGDGKSNSTNLRIRKQYTIDEKQFYVIELNETLARGQQIEIYIKYLGILNDYLQGFYRSSYTVGNETRWLATTQFQPTDARRAFPCFDEPEMKAKFNMKIGRPGNMVSLSNMPKKEKGIPMEKIANYFWDIYEESVPMSTYLVAFVVCDFISLSNGSFSVWARPDAIHSAAYALEIGPKILKFLEGFFGIKYPLPKMDMIALPDFAAGAMENWGLITYRETGMLFEENVSASSHKLRVATVVAHELAHQWFGNLVTPTWWTDLWLNEGFASYMEYLGADAVEPTWKSMDQFVVSELQNVFALDALSSSHQISIKVGNPDEINEIFDRISYTKGSTIIRMMNHFLTTEVFQKGLSNYLTKIAYQTADQDDLWEFLTVEARKSKVFDDTLSVKEIMDTWTLQTGFPLITVTRNYVDTKVELKQERFILIDQRNNKSQSSDEKPLWWIPITYTTKDVADFDDTKPDFWMRNNESKTVKDLNISNSNWLILNLHQTGYYRVNYDQENWKMIVEHLQNNQSYQQISPTNRAQLIDDSMNLARVGYINYSIPLDVTTYLRHETDYVPWKAALNSFSFIDSMLIRTASYELFRLYFLNLINELYQEVGLEESKNDSLLQIQKRVEILTVVCHLGEKECLNNCVRQFHMWIHEANPDNNNPISPNLKAIVYCTAIKYGDVREWNFAWERLQKTTIPSEKELLMTALGCSREPWILIRYLKRAMTDEFGIRKQDLFRVFLAVSNNVIGQPIAFNYIRSNWQNLRLYLGSSMSNLNMILKFTTRTINTRYELDEVKRFSIAELKETGRTIEQVMENAEANISWMTNNYAVIVNWLEEMKESLSLSESLQYLT